MIFTMASAQEDAMQMLLDPFAYRIRINKPVRDPKRLDHGWRSDYLAIPKGHKEEVMLFSLLPHEAEKYKRMKQDLLSRDSPAARKRRHKKIDDIWAKHVTDLSLLPKRVYAQQKKEWAPLLGKKFEGRMKKLQDQAKTSVYIEYAHARAKLKKEGKGPYAKTKSKGKKGKGKKKRSKKEILAAAFEKLEKFATAKKPPKPPKINRGKHGTVDPVLLEKLKTPKGITPKFVDDSNEIWRTQHFVPENTLTYVPSPRILEMSNPIMRIVDSPVILGQVDPEALVYRPTARILELAIPKKHDAVQVTVVNEDAFKVSENAKHYKASERIIELAKPKVRE